MNNSLLSRSGSPTMSRSGISAILVMNRHRSALSLMATVSKSTYTSTSPLEKQTSGMPHLHRTSSASCTLVERTTLRYTTVISADLQRDPAGNFDFDLDLDVDDDTCDPDFRRPMLPVQAAKAQNAVIAACFLFLPVLEIICEGEIESTRRLSVTNWVPPGEYCFILRMSS